MTVLKNELGKNELARDLEGLLEPLGVSIVDLSQKRSGGSAKVVLTILRNGGPTTTDDCALVHQAARPRLMAKLGAREIDLEVSSPGVERVFKDVREFSVFRGRRCRLFDTGRGACLAGVIGRTSEEGVRLSSWVREDTGETGDEILIGFADIGKAKLDFKQEGRK